jgi:hypothetical protein
MTSAATTRQRAPWLALGHRCRRDLHGAPTRPHQPTPNKSDETSVCHKQLCRAPVSMWTSVSWFPAGPAPAQKTWQMGGMADNAVPRRASPFGSFGQDDQAGDVLGGRLQREIIGGAVEGHPAPAAGCRRPTTVVGSASAGTRQAPTVQHTINATAGTTETGTSAHS